jgi:hypothetical protein
MESLNFVVLFSVVVVAWVGRMAHAHASVPLVKHTRVLLRREQIRIGMSVGALSAVPVSVASKRSRGIRLPSDRRIDSGRGRPLLCSN